MAFVGLVFEANPGAPKDGFVVRNAVVGEPLLPTVVTGINPVLVGQIVRLELPVESALDRRDAFRTGHWRKAGFEKLIFFQAFPPAAAATNGDVGIPAAQVA